MITGKQIRDARKRAGWSQARLAKEVTVAERTIGNWERGESSPGMKEPKLIDKLSPYLTVASQLESSSRPLNRISDVELLAEIACRFARGTESEGIEHGNSSEKINDGAEDSDPEVLIDDEAESFTTEADQPSRADDDK